jgi:hypothetical protein
VNAVADIVEAGPRRAPRTGRGSGPRAAGPRTGVRAAAAALALVLTAALVALSVRLLPADVPLRELAPAVDRVVLAHVPERLPTEAFRRRPCRVNDLLGASADRSLRRNYSAGGRLVEVGVYRVPAPRRRLDALPAALTACGGFESRARDGLLFRFRYADVHRDGDVVRWRLEGTTERFATRAHVRLSRVGPYLLYVSDQRLGPYEAPRAELDAIAGEVEAVLRANL